jgi:hypothetical protein
MGPFIVIIVGVQAMPCTKSYCIMEKPSALLHHDLLQCICTVHLCFLNVSPQDQGFLEIEVQPFHSCFVQEGLIQEPYHIKTFEKISKVGFNAGGSIRTFLKNPILMNAKGP